MNNTAKCLIILLACCTIFAVKPYYGGEVALRLNEPTDFAYTPSDFSNLVFYSLLYENLFYIQNDGDIHSNIFSRYDYDQTAKTVTMVLKENLSFSDGKPVTADSVTLSFRLFMELGVENSAGLRRIIKSVDADGNTNTVRLQLIYDNPDIISMLTVPELVLRSGADGVFSGMFYPVEWEKGRHIKLAPNIYYPGGRSYMDSVKVVFYDYYYPDFFLSKPNMKINGFQEFNAGIYQNIYLVFPQKGRLGNNSRMAMYTLLRDFAQTMDMTPLNVLTSEEESPVTLNIKEFSKRHARSILRRSGGKLYVVSSLKEFDNKLNEYFVNKNLRLDSVFVRETELTNLIENARVDYLMMVKVFNKRMPTEEKIKKIVKEMSFEQYDETYLTLLNQLDEVAALKNSELLFDNLSQLIEKVINDGFVLPLFQKRFSLYVRNNVQGIQLDYYGRPLFHRMSSTPPEIQYEEVPPTDEVKENKAESDPMKKTEAEEKKGVISNIR